MQVDFFCDRFVGGELNSRTAEQGTAEYRSEKIYLLLQTSSVRNSLFDVRYSNYNKGSIRGITFRPTFFDFFYFKSLTGNAR